MFVKKFLPIIHIIGLPGAGKTTLSRRISKTLDIPVLCIGQFRAMFPQTSEGEADAWVRLFAALSRRKWGRCILETTGLNAREKFLDISLPFEKKITIKLSAKRKTLLHRITLKKKSEQGGDWFYADRYPDKFSFVKKNFKFFNTVPALIEIDTSEMSKQEVFETAMAELKLFFLL